MESPQDDGELDPQEYGGAGRTPSEARGGWTEGTANQRFGRRASAFEGAWAPDGSSRKVPQENGGAGRNRTGE